MNKKGLTLNSLYPAVLAVIVVGLLLGIGIYVIAETRTAIAVDYSANQSINISSGSATLAQASSSGFGYVTNPATVFKWDNGTIISSPADYNITKAGAVTVSPKIVAIYSITNTTIMAVTYSYNYDATDSPEKSLSTSSTGVSGFASWIAIIVVVLAAAIVLGIVLSSFGKTSSV